MEPKEQEKQTQKKHTHRWWWAIAIIAGVCLLLFLLLPWILSTSGGKAFLENRISSAVDGQVKIGDLSLGWFRGVKVSDFVFEGPDGATRIQANRIEANPRLLGLLSGRLALENTVIESPDVRLAVTQDGRVKGLEGQADKKEAESGQKMQIGPLDLKVSNGRAVIRQALADNQYRQVEFRNIESTVKIPRSGTSDLALSLAVADNGSAGTVEANGRMESGGQGFSLEGLSGEFEMEVSSLALESLTPLLAIAGVTIEDLGGKLNATARLQMADGDLKTLVADARVENFRQKVGEQAINLPEPITAQAKITTENGNYLIEQLQIRSSFLTLSGQGGMNQFNYTLQSNLAQTQAVVGPLAGGLGGYALQGQLSGSGVIRMADEGIVSSGQMQVQQFSLAQGEKRVGPTPVELTYEATVNTDRQRAQIPSAVLTFEPGRLQLRNVTVNWADPMQADVGLGGQINLQKVRPYVNFFYALPEDVAIAGVAQPDLRVQMEGERLTVNAGNTRIENLRVSQPNTEPFVSQQVTVGGRAVLDLENSRLEELSDFSLTGDQIKLRGNLKRQSQDENADVSGRVEAEYDLKAMGNLISPFLPQRLELAGRRQDFFDFRSVYPQAQPDKMLANLNGTGKFGFDSAEMMGLHFGKADFNLTAKQGLVSLNLPQVPVNEGTLQFAGTIDLAQEPKFLRLEKAMPVLSDVHINDELSKNLLKFVNPAFADSLQVTGVADLTCEKLAVPLGGASMEDMLIEGSLQIENIKMQTGSFLGQLLRLAQSPTAATMQLRQTPFKVRDGVLNYERMQLEVGDRPFVFAGNVGITTDELNLSVQLPITARGESIKVGEQERGRPLAAGITGTIGSPRLSLQQTIESGVEDLIRGGLEQLLDKNRR